MGRPMIRRPPGSPAIRATWPLAPSPRAAAAPTAAKGSGSSPTLRRPRANLIGRATWAADDTLHRLHRAGWMVGEVGHGGTWTISGHNGEDLIRAEGRPQAEAWRRACDQAAAVGMLAPERG